MDGAIGSVPGLGPGGYEFESRSTEIFYILNIRVAHW